MVVRVEPLLHLLGGKIDTVTLASTAHGEVAVELGDLSISVLLGDDLGEISRGNADYQLRCSGSST